ncbi:sulfatase-like hydrolase/transferase [Ramlibacter sp. AW1]|uniref:Sulfatase-like hydrolase/transferase n=1 Tax=Ramlibacter aurantiacus TaxID=2801330 RepID=A0A937D842_9BURK|nr:sulfatase-like hydrolase/transferase [Ramlibacter aurantiacus]MBL0421656.1 sulfatase-like hydrolase/transferase [Ramlibacter aurantiacus]
MTRPNFLVFLTDQHRADHLGCYGNPVVRTPQIDELARSGSRFERTYVANPVCMPNRGSMMTGRMPSAHGARGNGVPLPLESVTFADVLAGSGWRTAMIGKSHLQNMENTPPALPPQAPSGLKAVPGLDQARRTRIDQPEYRQELRSSWADPAHQLRLPYYGFQEVILCNHHADECFGDYSRWLARHHPQVADRLGREHGSRDPAKTAPQAWRTQLDEFQYPTHYIAEQSQEWLRRHARDHAGEPFALLCSFPDPHHPWTPPGRYWDMYDPDAVQAPRTARSVDGQPPHVAWLWRERLAGQARLESPRFFAANEREIRDIIALTYGMITNIDDRIGGVMQTLRECGMDRDTVVIFTSDHGDLMGDHGIMLKGPLHYQGLIRVPLIWRDPEAPGGQVREDLASSMDLGPSILRRAGLAAPDGTQGEGLFEPSGATRPSGRTGVLVEESQQRAYLGFDTPVQVRTLVTRRHRLSLFQEGKWGELYDLEDDPLEERNLWDDPAHARLQSELLQELAQTMIRHADRCPRPTSLA